MRGFDNELIMQLIQMPDVEVTMRSTVNKNETAFITVTMYSVKYNTKLRRMFSIDDIDIFGFELLLRQMYCDLMGEIRQMYCDLMGDDKDA